MMYDGYMFGMGWIWILLLAAIIAVIAFALRSGSREVGGASTTPAGKTPEQVLRDRFARGEIDEREYRSRLKILEESR